MTKNYVAEDSPRNPARRACWLCTTPHRALVSRPRRPRGSQTHSPGRYLLSRFTPVVNRDLAPLQLLALWGTTPSLLLVKLTFGELTQISQFAIVFEYNIKKRYLNSICTGIILRCSKNEVTWPRGWIFKMTRSADFCKSKIWFISHSAALSWDRAIQSWIIHP